MFVFDAGYDPVKLQQVLEGSRPCQILVRLRAGRRFYGDPSLSDPPANIDRPRRHGPSARTRALGPKPSAEHTCEDDGYGAARVRGRIYIRRSPRTKVGVAGGLCRSWWERYC